MGYLMALREDGLFATGSPPFRLISPLEQICQKKRQPDRRFALFALATTAAVRAVVSGGASCFQFPVLIRGQYMNSPQTTNDLKTCVGPGGSPSFVDTLGTSGSLFSHLAVGAPVVPSNPLCVAVAWPRAPLQTGSSMSFLRQGSRLPEAVWAPAFMPRDGRCAGEGAPDRHSPGVSGRSLSPGWSRCCKPACLHGLVWFAPRRFGHACGPSVAVA
jgi:hypothetical protein